jgi:hypothetical protein
VIATLRLPPNAAIIEAALEGLVRVNLVLMETGVIPPFPHETDVIYRLEPEGEEDWKHGSNAIRDGWADCEDLAAWCVAGLRFSGEDEAARCAILRTGPTNMHCVVLMSDGRIWDPSMDLGMLTNNRLRGVRKGE